MIFIKNKKIRNIIKIAVPFIIIPLIVAMGALVFDAKKHIFISLAIAFMTLIFFMAGFDKKAKITRKTVIVAIMTALCVVGRFIPFFKPVTAIATISAIYLGSEAGFLIGAYSAILSNIYFGQGPWTPFQMLSCGMIGLIAGLLSEPLKKNKIFLMIYGILSGIAYSFIMDIWTVLWYNDSFDFSLYLMALGTAVPYTILYSVSNFIFLWIMAKPFGDKLERIKLKYGI